MACNSPGGMPALRKRLEHPSPHGLNKPHSLRTERISGPKRKKMVKKSLSRGTKWGINLLHSAKVAPSQDGGGGGAQIIQGRPVFQNRVVENIPEYSGIL